MENVRMFVDFLLISGMALLFLISVFLFKSKTDFSKKILILFFVNAFFFLLYYYAFTHRAKVLGAIAFLFGNGTGYLLGPALLFYLKALVQPKEKIIKPFIRHFIPFILSFILISIPIAFSIVSEKTTGYGKAYASVADYLNLLENTFFIVYILLSLRLLKRIQKTCENHYSSFDKNNLNWFGILVIGLLSIIILDSLFSIYELFAPVYRWNIGTIIAFTFIALYSILGYKGMFQSKILLPDFLASDPETNTTDTFLKSESKKQYTGRLDGLNETEIDKLIQKLHAILEKKKPYLSDSLSLTELADEMGINNKELSELLNKHLNTSFYNLINTYRVDEFKHKITQSENEKYTLIALAYECGFQSKASFNRVFKQQTGMAPSKYKNSLQKRQTL